MYKEHLLKDIQYVTIKQNLNNYKTELNLKIAEKIAEKIAYFIEQVSADLSEEERLQFYHSLSLISKNLDNIINKKV